MTPRIFRYVVRYDSGVAPRPFDGWCSLAICKSKIRASARVGDWIIGFRTRSPGDVIYAMQVEEVLSFAEYWADKRFRNRRPGVTSTPDNTIAPRMTEFSSRSRTMYMTQPKLRPTLEDEMFWCRRRFGISEKPVPWSPPNLCT